MSQFVPGSRLGPYELTSRLGAGGMGEVWLATDSRLGRSVAIKVIAGSVAADPHIRARMQGEARSVSALNHPNICSLFDIGQENGSDYLVMEFVEGQTLAERLVAGSLSTEAIVAIATQIVDAIGEAHAHGVTHRDLKPANIMITTSGRVKVLDFGLAKRAVVSADDNTAVQSSAGMMIGTLAYMSPEQASGAPADQRSDIFSIGVVLYELATGMRPFEGTPAQIAAQLLGSSARPPRAVNPNIPIKLERLIVRCMAKSPADRYQSAAELLAELQNVTSRSKASSPARAAAKKTKVESLAVLPFTNSTGDPQLSFLSDGIAEGVLHQLAQVSNLRVLARSTTFRYRDTPDPIAAAREMKVHAVLTGELTMRRGSVAVSAELVDAKTGAHLWGNAWPDAEAHTVQQQIAKEASEALHARIGNKPAHRAVDEEAYRLYLRGRYSLNKWTPQSLHSAIQSFQNAIDRDPSFALGFAGLADAYLMFEPFTHSVARGSLPKARAAAMRALQLDETLAEAYTSLAMTDFTEWYWEAAERGFQRAIAINPNYEVAHNWYSRYLITVGRWDEALAAAERARQIDPLSATIAAHAATCKILTGRIADGIRDLQDLAASEPNIPMIHQWLAFGYQQNGQYDLAIDELRQEVESSGNGILARACLGFALGMSGKTEEARAVLEDLLALYPTGDVQPFWIAGIYAGLGDEDRALEWLEKSVYSGRGGHATIYITWPAWFDKLKTNPRYVALLRHMGLVN